MPQINDLCEHVLGENVRMLREGRGMSRAALAAKLHISARTLKNLENGVIGPRMKVDLLFALSEIFHTTPDGLFRSR